MSVGTGAFSSVEADRGVEVNVVEDDEAYLGLDVKTRTVTVGQSTEVVEITNRFADTENLSLDVTVESTDDIVDEVTVSDQNLGKRSSLEIGSGESEPVSIRCNQSGSASFKLQFIGEVGGSSVEKTRKFNDINCEAKSNQEISGITFESGKSGIVINRDEATGASVYYEKDSGLGKAYSDDVSVNETLKLKQDFDGPNNGGEIVAVAVDGVEGIYVHPDFNKTDYEIPASSGQAKTQTDTEPSGYLDEYTN
ncbi:hypothetical protein [Halorubrum halophilum]|uniref:hypothetical protein n=1 Tax=Halorubrum halophilum TaxID=413816 RepID=UPI0012AB4C12|nr:hypothetical protein [Halorubrum halophilum]